LGWREGVGVATVPTLGKALPKRPPLWRGPRSRWLGAVRCQDPDRHYGGDHETTDQKHAGLIASSQARPRPGGRRHRQRELPAVGRPEEVRRDRRGGGATLERSLSPLSRLPAM